MSGTLTYDAPFLLSSHPLADCLFQSGKCDTVLQAFVEPVTTAAWLPDGQSFVIGSLDKKTALSLWSVTGDRLHTWDAPYRTQDLAVAPDGSRLVTLSVERQIFMYDLASRAQEYSLRLKTDMTCVTISRDSRHMLVNMADNELQLIDVRSAEIVQRFMGQKQGKYVIRSAFGGVDENLVISGSEGTTLASSPPLLRPIYMFDALLWRDEAVKLASLSFKMSRK